MLTPAEQGNVLLIRQANGGCGMARNAALDVMPGNIEWIAFLDSDDRWKPAHLVRAITALQEGFDFFFADVIRDPEPRTHFATAFLSLASTNALALCLIYTGSWEIS